MKYVAWFRVTNEMFKDVPILTKVLVQEYDWHRLKQLSIGLRLMNPVVQSGLNGDDIVKNLRTIVIEYDAYRVPRFVKTSLQKKFKLTDIKKATLVEEILKSMN